MPRAWLTEAQKWESREITKEECDEWRYKYQELDTHQIWAKVYPQELFDFIDDCAKKAEKEEKKEAKRKKKNRHKKTLPFSVVCSENGKVF